LLAFAETMGAMDDSETLALSYISSIGYSSITYEPDGNIPPDFLVDGKIAIEVRRLNYNRITESGKSQGVENSQFAVLRMMNELLPLLGSSDTGRSWWVTYRFKRPIPHLDILRNKVRDALQTFREGASEESELQIADHFVLNLLPPTDVRSNCFSVGGFTDMDVGGWLIPLLEQNIRICVAEKSKKIAKVRARYSEWWLILIDHIGFGSRESIHVDHDWTKVILVNPLNPKKGYEINCVGHQSDPVDD